MYWEIPNEMFVLQKSQAVPWWFPRFTIILLSRIGVVQNTGVTTLVYSQIKPSYVIFPGRTNVIILWGKDYIQNLKEVPSSKNGGILLLKWNCYHRPGRWRPLLALHQMYVDFGKGITVVTDMWNKIKWRNKINTRTWRVLTPCKAQDTSSTSKYSS